MPIPVQEFFARLKWIKGEDLLSTIEPYRRTFFTKALDTRDRRGALRYNLVLSGRAKKNWKSADLCLATLYRLLSDSPGGNQCYILANDEGQAADDLELVKLLISANALLDEWLRIKQKVVERKDGRGFLEILPAQNFVGQHGRTYAIAAFDEIHGYRTWDLLEAMQLDPTRDDSQMWITSYASIYHKPGVPLFDMCQQGWAGTDPRMLFSWYAADKTTDPDFLNADPETRANPSRCSWTDSLYLEQQRRRLPAHKFRRLHLNLGGLPEGAPFAAESIMDAVERGIRVRLPEPGLTYHAFIDMSGGSNDDAVLAIGHRDAEGRAVTDRVMDQGQRPPFDPLKAIDRFVPVLTDYRVRSVTGDKYAGETFKSAFENRGFRYCVSALTKSELYEALEPRLNTHSVALLDDGTTEQQLLGLIWRGGKIDHQNGEHDDWANSGAGLVELLANPAITYGANAVNSEEKDDESSGEPVRRFTESTVF